MVSIFTFVFAFHALAADRTLNQKITHLEELERKVSEVCVKSPDKSDVKVTVGNQVLTCPQLIVVTDRLHDQIDREVGQLQKCEQDYQTSQEANRLAAQTLEITRKSVQCPRQPGDLQCLGQLSCSMFMVSNPLAALIGGASKLAGGKNGCGGTNLAQQGLGCLTSVVKGIFDSLWGLVSMIWDVGKAAVRKAGEWIGIVKKSEEATSDKLMAAQQAGPGFIKRFVSNPVQTMKDMASMIYNGIKEAAMSSYGCEQWSGAPLVSRCLKPMTNWQCASCQQRLQVMCGVAGFAIGEIGTALLTGGLAAGAKAVAVSSAKVIARAAKAGKVSRMATTVLKTIPKSAEIIEAASKAGLALAKGTGRILSATEKQAVRAWKAVEGSAPSRVIQSAANAVSKSAAGDAARMALKPVGVYLDALDEAAELGFKTVDNAIGSIGNKGVKAGEASRTVQSTIPADEMKVETVAETVTTESKGLTVTDNVVESSPQRSGLTVSSANQETRVPITTTRQVTTAPTQVKPPVPSKVSKSELTVVKTEAEVRHPDDIIRSFIGKEPSYEEREAFLECLFERQDTYHAKKKYLRARKNQALFTVQLCRQLRADPAKKQAIRDEIEAFGRSRLSAANEAVEKEIAELGSSVEKRSVDCRELNKLYGGAFPDTGAECFGVKMKENVSGKYCGCGDTGKNTFNFVTKCPTDAAGFKSLSQFYDHLALPSTSKLQVCGRVDIPEGKECYAGPTTVAFAGYGGGTQLLCFNKHYGNYDSEHAETIAKNGFDTNKSGALTVEPQRWSPFSDFDEFQGIIQEASRVCPEKCSPADLSRLSQEYQTQRNSLRSAYADNPEALARLDEEDKIFNIYFQDLQVGRAKSFSESERLSELRRSASALSPQERIQEAESALGRQLSEKEKTALLKAHDVGGTENRGFGTYTREDKFRKGSALMREGGFTRDEAQLLMDRHIAGASAQLDRYDGIRAVDEAKKALGRLQSGPAGLTKEQIGEFVEKFKTQQHLAGDAFAAEAAARAKAGDKAYSLVNTKLSWEGYLASGDANSALSMIESGISQGMKKEAILEGLLKKRRALEAERNPALIIEKQSLEQVITKLRGNTAPVKTTPPPVTTKPVVTSTPQKTATAEVKTEAEVIKEIPVEVAPVSNRLPPSVNPKEAESLANEYRLGINGKTKNPSKASLYYERAAEDYFSKQLVKKGDAAFFSDRNIYSAFTLSLAGDGEVALRMVQRISEKSYQGLNNFVNEIHEMNLYIHKTPELRANMRKVIEALDAHKNELYSPQQSMLRNWRGYNSEN